MDWRVEGVNDTEMTANNMGVSMKNENAATNDKGGKENENVVINDSEEDRNKKKAGWVPLLLIVGLWIVLEISGWVPITISTLPALRSFMVSLTSFGVQNLHRSLISIGKSFILSLKGL